MGQFLQDGKNDQTLSKKIFFAASLWPNGLTFSTFLNCSEEICPLHLKNSLVLVLAQYFDQAIFTDFTPKLWFLAIFEVDIMPSWN